MDKLIRITLKLQDKFSKEMQGANNQLKNLSGNLKSVGTGLSLGVTAPLVAIGGAGIKMASDLDRSMRNVQSVGRQTEEELQALSDTFVDMSTDITVTTDSAVNLADAFYDIQGSGFEGADAMKVLESATKAASAGLTTTATAAEGLTGVLNAYGKGANEAQITSDLMFRTVDRGVGSYEALAGSMSNVVGTASALDVPFEVVSAAMATMSKQSMTFSEASVSLNMALTSLLKPSTAMQGALNELGYESGLALLQSKGLAGTLEALGEVVDNDQAKLASMFGNVRALRAVFGLTGNGAKIFAEDLEAMGSAAGATAEAFAIQTQSFSATFANFKNVFNATLIEIGQILLPMLKGFLESILPIIKGFRELSPTMQKTIVVLGMLAAAVGPVLIIVSQLINAFLVIKAALVAVGAVGSVAFLPVIAVIGVLIGLGYLLIKNWDAVSSAMKNWGKMILLVAHFASKGAQQIAEAIAVKLRSAIEGLKQFFPNFWENLKTVIKGIWDFIKGMFQKLLNLVPDFIKNFFGGLIKGIISGGAGVVKAVGDFTMGMINKIRSALKISSPSKVMAEIGKSMSEGIYEGFVEGATLDKIVKEVSSILNEGDFIGAGAFGEDSAITDGLFSFREKMGETTQYTSEQVNEIAKAIFSMTKETGQGAIEMTKQASNAMVQMATQAQSIRQQLSGGGTTMLGSGIKQTFGSMSQYVDIFKKVGGSGFKNALSQKLFAQDYGLGMSQNRRSIIDMIDQKVRQVAGSSTSPMVASAGTSSGASATVINVGAIQIPPGSTEEQAREILNQIGRQMKKKGFRQ